MAFFCIFILCTIKQILSQMDTVLIVKFKHPLVKVQGDILLLPRFNYAVYFPRAATILLFATT